MNISIGDTVKFALGGAPFIGTVLFAVTPSAAAVRLPSGTEIIIDLETVNKVVK